MYEEERTMAINECLNNIDIYADNIKNVMSKALPLAVSMDEIQGLKKIVHDDCEGIKRNILNVVEIKNYDNDLASALFDPIECLSQPTANLEPNEVITQTYKDSRFNDKRAYSDNGRLKSNLKDVDVLVNRIKHTVGDMILSATYADVGKWERYANDIANTIESYMDFSSEIIENQINNKRYGDKMKMAENMKDDLKEEMLNAEDDFESLFSDVDKDTSLALLKTKKDKMDESLKTVQQKLDKLNELYKTEIIQGRKQRRDEIAKKLDNNNKIESADELER